MTNSEDDFTITTISQKEALDLDEFLMGEQTGYSLSQLMELAGLSASIAIMEILNNKFPNSSKNILICCGPGNNGGDGLVIARHLSEFGFNVTVLYPFRKSGELYDRLLLLLNSYGVKVSDNIHLGLEEFSVILDAIFGISFKHPVREPFNSLLQNLVKTNKPIISLDIPSGWDVNEGPTSYPSLDPCVLISLAVPKRCASKFNKTHYLCGRFVPKNVIKNFGIKLPRFNSSNQIVDITGFKLN